MVSQMYLFFVMYLSFMIFFFMVTLLPSLGRVMGHPILLLVCAEAVFGSEWLSGNALIMEHPAMYTLQ